MSRLGTIARVIGERLWIRFDDAGIEAAETISPAVQAARLRRAAYTAGAPERAERETARLRTCRLKVQAMIDEFEKEQASG